MARKVAIATADDESAVAPESHGFEFRVVESWSFNVSVFSEFVPRIAKVE